MGRIELLSSAVAEMVHVGSAAADETFDNAHIYGFELEYDIELDDFSYAYMYVPSIYE